jgi:hypothetical protein
MTFILQQNYKIKWGARGKNKKSNRGDELDQSTLHTHWEYFEIPLYS